MKQPKMIKDGLIGKFGGYEQHKGPLFKEIKKGDIGHFPNNKQR